MVADNSFPSQGAHQQGSGTGEPGSSASPLESAAGREALERVRSVLNHDLRTPLTVIISYAQTLAQGKAGEMNERQREMLETVVQEGFRMDELIRELVGLLREAMGDRVEE